MTETIVNMLFWMAVVILIVCLILMIVDAARRDLSEFAEGDDDELSRIDELIDGIEEVQFRRGLDQTAKADAGKIRPTLVPTEAIEDIAIVRGYGNQKYGSSDNWKTVEVERYRDALFRHLLAYLKDPKSKDEESGLFHYQHLICNAAFICALERETNEE